MSIDHTLIAYVLDDWLKYRRREGSNVGGLDEQVVEQIAALKAAVLDTEGDRPLETVMSRRCRDAAAVIKGKASAFDASDLLIEAAKVIESLVDRADTEGDQPTPQATWVCGCGAWNGVNLALCGVCTRPRTYTASR